MIAAIDARKSKDQTGVAEEQKSVAHQIDHGRAYATRKGWTVAEDHVFVDDRITGAEFAKRPGFLRLMNSLKPKPKFQVLIMSEESRLGRESIETAYALKQLITADVQVWFYLEDRQRTLDSPMENIMLSLTAFADELEREKARQRTTDAMQRLARRGFVTGGRVFGYDNVPIVGADGRRSHVERQVNVHEAAVVRRIFELCAQGYGKARIALSLNADAAPAPRSQQRRPAGWAASSVHEVLYRRIYVGEIVWNRTRKRDKWGVRKNRARPEHEWVRVEASVLRIIPEALWHAAHARLDASRELYLRSTGGRLWGKPMNGLDAKYLLTGLVECACCGGTLEVRSRRHGRTRVRFYMCSTHRRRGPAVCKGLDVPMDRGDAAILSVLESRLLNRDVLERACARVLERLARPAVDSQARRADLIKRVSAIDLELARMTDALATGEKPMSVVQGIRQRELERAAIVQHIRSLEPRAALSAADVRRTLDELVTNWRVIVRRNVTQGRQMIAKLLRARIAFEPETRDEQAGFRVRLRGTIVKVLDVVLHVDVLAVEAVRSGAPNVCTSCGVPNG